MVAQTRKSGVGTSTNTGGPTTTTTTTKTTKTGPPSPQKLKFNEKLVGKGLSTDALLKKLKALHTELAELDQENVNLKSLGACTKELVSTGILLHKDKGVKAYAACCLADLLRLYAPDAPYTAPELSDIFQFFFRQLATGLQRGSDSAYYSEYFHLLESLSTVKSVVLVCDLPGADELMVQVFRDFFGLVRLDLAKNVEMFMADILVALVDECQILPADVLDVIMAQFMDNAASSTSTNKDNKDKSDKEKEKENNNAAGLTHTQPAYRLAVAVCNATADKLQRHVCQYFTDIIVSSAHDLSDENYASVRSAHTLIKRLHHSCPSLLHSVVPQLEEELRVEEVQLRVMATQVLGEMFSDSGNFKGGGSGGELEKKYPSTWALWVARKNDKSAVVRLAWVEACRGLVLGAQSEERRGVVEESLETKLYDPDEKIRGAACRLYAQLDYETALHHVSAKMLRAVGGRGVDKKQSVRHEALTSIGKLYSVAYPEIENGDAGAIAHFAWIPEQVLHAVTATLEVKPTAEQVLWQYILPLPPKTSDSDPGSGSGGKGGVGEGAGGTAGAGAWTDRLLTIMRYLDEKAVGTLLGISGVRNARPTVFERFVQCCVENNGGIIDEDEEAVKRRLNMVVKHIASFFHDPIKAAEDLHAFAKINEQRLYKLLTTCMDTQSDVKTIVKASSEFVKRLEQQSSGIVGTMASFLRKATLWIVNQSSIPTLVKRVQKGGEDDPHPPGNRGKKKGQSQAQVAANNAQALLVCVAKHCAGVLKPHVAEFAKAVASADKDKDGNGRLVEVCLMALAAVAKAEKGVVNDKRTIERVKKYAYEANPRHAKFAARILAHSKKSEEICAEVVEKIAGNLSDADPELLVAHIAVLAELATSAPDAFELKSDVIIGFLVKETLMAPCPSDENAMDADDDEVEWAEEDALPPLARAKILSLKVCRRRCLAHAQTEDALEIASPVLKMFFTLLANGGSIKEDADDDPKVKSRVRLQAAWSLVQLATVEKFSEAIAPNFVLLALTVQDSCFQVRIGFLTKLVGLLHTRKLHPRFNLIPFLTVHDPEAEVKEKARNNIAFAFRRAPPDLKVSQYEMPFIRLLHVLAHHPDFGLEEDVLQQTAKYINFYLDLIATADNLPLLYHLAMKAKTVRDAESNTSSENLYVTSELAQELIKRRTKQHGWSLTSYPGKIKLPSDIFRALPNPELANKACFIFLILKTQYLPAEALKWLDDMEKPAPKERTKTERKAAPKRKAQRRSNGSAKRGRPRRKKQESSDHEGIHDDDSEKEDDSDAASEASNAGVVPKSPTEEGDSDEEKSEEETGEERLGRGARTRAKAKAKRHAKRKTKANGPSSDE
ncbi:ARM repeat-containing protein [Rickenella mellea]|uniref:ARM repeat-containing protein n=1 Tax=Rickenella mellea TaxID=50990 RepID=A0A4Y7PYE2_9AGAM|nr:ARM repeat-containing protein [Rickenella mellea]